MMTTVAQQCTGVACYSVVAWPEHGVRVINKWISGHYGGVLHG